MQHGCVQVEDVRGCWVNLDMKNQCFFSNHKLSFSVVVLGYEDMDLSFVGCLNGEVQMCVK